MLNVVVLLLFCVFFAVWLRSYLLVAQCFVQLWLLWSSLISLCISLSCDIPYYILFLSHLLFFLGVSSESSLPFWDHSAASSNGEDNTPIINNYYYKSMVKAATMVLVDGYNSHGFIQLLEGLHEMTPSCYWTALPPASNCSLQGRVMPGHAGPTVDQGGVASRRTV